MKIREVIEEPGNARDEFVLIQADANPDPFSPEIKNLWEGPLGEIPERFRELNCKICWSMAHSCAVLDVGFLEEEPKEPEEGPGPEEEQEQEDEKLGEILRGWKNLTELGKADMLKVFREHIQEARREEARAQAREWSRAARDFWTITATFPDGSEVEWLALSEEKAGDCEMRLSEIYEDAEEIRVEGPFRDIPQGKIWK